jgi:hypothetical protein
VTFNIECHLGCHLDFSFNIDLASSVNASLTNLEPFKVNRKNVEQPPIELRRRCQNNNNNNNKRKLQFFA